MKLTLCGSSKFKERFDEWNTKLTKEGHIVYAIAVAKEHEVLDKITKIKLDVVHFMKIDNSDAIFVLDEDDYIGESTVREVIYALNTNKDIYLASYGMDHKLHEFSPTVERLDKLVDEFNKRN